MPSGAVITSIAAIVAFMLAYVSLWFGNLGRGLLVALFICAGLWLIIIIGANAAAQNRLTFDTFVHASGPLFGAIAATVLYFFRNSGD